MVTNIIFALLCTCFSAVYGVELRLELEGVEEQQGIATVGIDESFQVQLTVIADKSIHGAIPIEGLNKFSVHSTSTSRSISMGGRRQSVEEVYSYDVSAHQAGEFVLGPAKVVLDGKNVFSNSLKIKVVPGAVSASSRSTSLASSSSSQNRSGNIQVVVHADKKQVFVGEPLFITVETKIQGAVLQIQLPQPQIAGFNVKELGQGRDEIQGINRIHQRKYCLTPLQTGFHKIGPLRIAYQVPVSLHAHGFGFSHSLLSSFFGPQAQTRHASSNEISIEVSPLPVKESDIEGVGEFTRYSLYLDKKEVAVNEPSVLTVEVQGNGNLDQIGAPELKLPAQCRFYFSKSHTHYDTLGNAEGATKKFEYILQGVKPGVHTIPAQQFAFFDTRTRSIKTLASDPFQFTVNAPTEEEDAHGLSSYQGGGTDEKKSQEQKGGVNEEKINDIRPLQFQQSESTSSLNQWILPWWLFLILMFFIPFIFNLKRVMYYKEELYTYFLSKQQKHRHSMKAFKREIDELEKQQAYFHFYTLFIKIVCVYLNTPFDSFNEDALEQKLKERHWGDEKIKQFTAFLNECAESSFAGDNQKNQDKKRLFAKVHYWFMVLSENNNDK